MLLAKEMQKDLLDNHILKASLHFLLLLNMILSWRPLKRVDKQTILESILLWSFGPGI